jgi:hypothetical protein
MRVMERDRDVRKGAGVVRGVRGGRRRGRAALAAALGIAATASVLAHQAPASAATPPLTYEMTWINNLGKTPTDPWRESGNMTLIFGGGSSVASEPTSVSQQDPGAYSRHWTFSQDNVNKGTWRIRSRATGQCLTHYVYRSWDSGEGVDVTGLWLQPCGRRGDQMFVWTDTGKNWWYTLRGLGRPATQTMWYRLTPR